MYTSMNAIYQASLRLYQPKYWRGKNGKDQTGALALPGGGVCGRGRYGRLGFLFMNQLLGIYSGEPEVISYGALRMELIFSTYFFCGMMDVACGSVRGLGYSITPTVISLTGAAACGFMDLYRFRFGPFLVYLVFVLSRDLGGYFFRPSGMLLYFSQKGKAESRLGNTAARA